MWVVCRGSLQCPGRLGCTDGFRAVCRCLHSYCQKIPTSFFFTWYYDLFPLFSVAGPILFFPPLPYLFLYPNSLQTSNLLLPNPPSRPVSILLPVYSNLMFPIPLVRQCWPYRVLLIQLLRLRQLPKTTPPNSPTITWFLLAMLFFLFHTLTKANYSTLALIPLPISN